VLGFEVDRGEDAVRRHAAQQVEAGDAGAGADLGDRLGLQRRSEKRQRRAGAGADRRRAEPCPLLASGGQMLVFGVEVLGEGQARCGGDDALLVKPTVVAQPSVIVSTRGGDM